MKDDRLDKHLASLSGQARTPARRRLHELVPLGDEDIPRHRLIERLIDEGGSLRELTSMRATKDGGISLMTKGVVLVLGDGENYWDPREVSPAGMRYAHWLIMNKQVRPVPKGAKCIGRIEE